MRPLKDATASKAQWSSAYSDLPRTWSLSREQLRDLEKRIDGKRYCHKGLCRAGFLRLQVRRANNDAAQRI